MARGNIISTKKLGHVRRAISISLDEETFLWIDDLADRQSTSFTAIARRLLEESKASREASKCP